MYLLQMLGTKHLAVGFDRATSKLSNTNSAENSNLQAISIFMEMIHMGDLILQMVDVFFEERLVTLSIIFNV